jgi:hypothetical protein
MRFRRFGSFNYYLGVLRYYGLREAFATWLLHRQQIIERECWEDWLNYDREIPAKEGTE